MSTPLTAYMDAVADALMDAEVGVRDHYADQRAQRIGIDLDPVSAVRQPVVTWTPSAGWRIAMMCRGRVRPATLRYLAAGMTPRPGTVAEFTRLWLAAPDALTAVEPLYAAPPGVLARRLTAATESADEQDGDETDG